MTMNAGLFKLDVTDHHAVIGFSLAEDPKKVRKRYLKVARVLHPDSFRDATAEERTIANDLLSKLVNPSYKVLSQAKSAKEHSLVLKMKQQQLAARPVLLSAKSDAAKKLLGTSNLDLDYTSALQKLAAVQFEDLTKFEIVTGEISELNAVYLMRKGDVGARAPLPSAGGKSAEKEKAEEAPRRPRHEAIIESYMSRAKEFEYKRDYSRAILELREAIASHPQSPPCHAYLSALYLKSGQATLAKIHAKQALSFDADNEMAKGVQAKLEKAQAPAKAGKGSAKGAAKGAKAGGGLFSGLFGGKKG